MTFRGDARLASKSKSPEGSCQRKVKNQLQLAPSYLPFCSSLVLMKTNPNKEKSTTEFSHPGNNKSSTIKTIILLYDYVYFQLSDAFTHFINAPLDFFSYTLAYILFSSFILSRQKNLSFSWSELSIELMVLSGM